MNAIVTVTIGKNYKDIASMTHHTLRAYAKRVGADFVVLDSQALSTVSPHYEKFQLYYLLNKYDRIVYLDTDIIVRDDCPNLFEMVPYHMIGLVNEGRYQDRTEQMVETCKEYGGDFRDYDINKYYNTGVMVLSRVHKELFVKPGKESVWNFYEQSYLNLRIQEMRLRVFDLGHKFNRVAIMDGFHGEHRLASYIVHYAGVMSGLNGLIPSDLARWESGEHRKMKRRIMVGVGAKLGDNICAEPVVRYMVDNAVDTDFTVATMHPEVFEHLPVAMIPFDAVPKGNNPENPCIFFNTAMDEKDGRRRLLSPDYMHATDYASLLCLKRQLPDAAKQIRLRVDPMSLANVMQICSDPSELILVHPGKSWPSKTFPVDFWEDVVGGIVAKGLKVGVIGRNVSKDLGVLDIATPGGVYDFRNLLNLRELIALISKARTLVSNDSAPIHIAGAFANRLVVIPTCKHPDLILPYRSGSKYHNTSVCMGSAHMWQVAGFDQSDLYNYDMSKVDDVTKYLPTPRVVIREATK